METLYARERDEWRAWLEKHHASKTEIWLIYYKKGSGKPSVHYEEAVEEAICFGWIDGKVKSIDAEKYMQRYTPRNSGSAWSDVNIKRANKMVRAGLMTRVGLDAFSAGKRNPRKIPSSKSFTVPEDLQSALAKRPEAMKNFNEFAPSTRLMYAYWVDSAKRAETRKRRIQEVVERSIVKKKPGDL
jgi:uncharacterized protein YdeI (YjbR/CyaY-like superfamily)